MAVLVAPDENTKMVRSGEFWNRKKWHILGSNRFRVGVCGTVCIDPEYSTLEEVKAKDICSLCWVFEKR